MARTLATLLCFPSSVGAPSIARAQQSILPPLHTSGYQILDANSHPVRLTSVNWYGFDQKEYSRRRTRSCGTTGNHRPDQIYRGQLGETALGKRDG